MIIKYPLSTEKSIRLMESENKLIFVVERKSTKNEIKNEMEKLFNVKVLDVKTLMDKNGKKRAYIKFSPETPALDVATKMGMM